MPFDDEDDSKYITPAKTRGASVDPHLDLLLSFAKKNGLTPGSTTGGRHNAGSRHYSGNALDIKGSGAFDDARVAQLSKLAAAEGLILRDERRRPVGQKVWGGAHIHLEHAPSQADDDKYIVRQPVVEDEDAKYVVGTAPPASTRSGLFNPSTQKDIGLAANRRGKPLREQPPQSTRSGLFDKQPIQRPASTRSGLFEPKPGIADLKRADEEAIKPYVQAQNVRAAAKAAAPPGFSLLPEVMQEWIIGAGAKGGAGLTELTAGVMRSPASLVPALLIVEKEARALGMKPKLPTERLADHMNTVVQEIQGGAMEMDRQAARGFLSQTTQDVLGGSIASAPAMALVALGVPAPVAFGLQSYLSARGRDAELSETLLETGKGATIGKLFELPVPKKLELLAKAGSKLGVAGKAGYKAGTVGTGTFLVEAGTGTPVKDAGTNAAVNALFAGSGLAGLAKRKGKVTLPEPPRIKSERVLPPEAQAGIEQAKVEVRRAIDERRAGELPTAEYPAVPSKVKPLPKKEPPVPEGHTRLYRGTSGPSDIVRQGSPAFQEFMRSEYPEQFHGKWFSADKNYARSFSKTDAEISYVDVLTKDLPKYKAEGVAGTEGLYQEPGKEFLYPAPAVERGTWKPGLKPETARMATETAQAEVQRGTPLESTEVRMAGLDPAAAIKAADDLSREGFTLDRGRLLDFDYLDYFRTPLSNLNFKGFLERIGGDTGKQASDAIRRAQVNTQEQFLEWQKPIKAIEGLLDDVRGASSKKDFYAEFVDLVEKPFGDPTRTSFDPNVVKAIEMHDKLTADWKNYIIESRRTLGIETPPDWGVTDRGYFRHLFLGDIQMFRDGQFIGTAQTYTQAQKMALDILKAEPAAKIHAQARNTFAGAPTTRFFDTGRRRFWNKVSKLTGSEKVPNKGGDLGEGITLTKEDILSDIKGERRPGARQKFLGALMKREGFEGYSKAYVEVMEAHASQLARSQELSKLSYELEPIVKELRDSGKPGLAEEIESQLETLWGTPSKQEKAVGNLIRKTPVLRNHVSNPDLAFRSLARRLTSVQAFLKLDFNIRASIVNLTDPLTTLWPYTSSRDYAALIAEALKPSTRAVLRERGVLTGATKLEGNTLVTGKEYKIPRPFRAASNFNRSIGYLYGIKDGTRKGLTGDGLHRYGLEWAKKVEFDNSIWNVAPILRTPAGKVLGQFKGYPLKALENIATLSRKHEGDTSFSRAKRIGKFAVAKASVGGAKALLSPTRVILGVGGYEMVVALSSQLQQYGMSKEQADKAAQAVYYGAPALMGQDLSASVAVLDEFYGNSPEEKIVNFLAGPTVGGALGAYKSKSLEQLASRTSPYLRGVSTAKQMYDRGDGTSTIPAGRGEEIELTPFESVMRILGFTPVKQSEHFAKGKSVKQQTVAKLKERIRAGDQAALAEAREMKRQGKLNAANITEIRKAHYQDDVVQGFNKLKLVDAEEEYKEMSPEDQQKVQQILLRKRRAKGIFTQP